MNRALGAAVPLLLVAAICNPAAATEAQPALTAAPPPDNLIQRIEKTQGAYGADLPEQLLSQGLELQRQGHHRQAAALFKRGVHVTRINDGLYSELQIPLLQAEVESLTALETYASADERRDYLFKVQMRGLAEGEPTAPVLISHAQWQHRAYALKIGDHLELRLNRMWSLYNNALNEVSRREGPMSAQLLSPLFGMLQTQYLIASFAGESAATTYNGRANERPDASRFTVVRTGSLRHGRQVIEAIYDIHSANDGANSIEAAESLVLMGDWLQWNRERQAAVKVYRDAFAELEQLDDAQLQLERLFGAPVALPALKGLRSLPPIVAPEDGDVVLEFAVNELGRVTNLKRLDEPEASEKKANSLMRSLRKTTFRPRFAAQGPIGTNSIVKAFDIE